MTCPSCGGRSDDALICPRELLGMRDDLDTIIELWAELEITLTRQTRMGGDRPNTRHLKMKSVPLPFDTRASDLGHEIRATLTAWWRTFDTTGLNPNTVPHIAECLTLTSDLIAGHDEAPQFLGALKDITRLMHRAIDCPPESLYLGPCNHRIDDRTTCKHQMYANPRDDAYMCPGEVGIPCGKLYNVSERQSEMLELGRDMHATIGQCAAFLARFGLATPIRTIESWTVARPSKGGLTYPARVWATGHNGTANLYRIGDMESLARERLAKKTDTKTLVGSTP